MYDMPVALWNELGEGAPVCTTCLHGWEEAVG